MTRLGYLIAESSFDTQYSVAGAARVCPSTLSQYINGSKPFLPSHTERLCLVLGTTGVEGWVELEVVA